MIYFLKYIPTQIENVSREILNGETRQAVQDILNKTVGRIRAKYSRILSIDLESGKIVRDNTVFIGKITNHGPNIGV